MGRPRACSIRFDAGMASAAARYQGNWSDYASCREVGIDFRTLAAVWKANIPAIVWMCSPLWIAPIILGLDGKTPEWGPIALFVIAVTAIMAIAEFANTYTDRDEDWLYFPSSPLVTGELDAGTARKAFILQNMLAGALLIALVLVTHSYSLMMVLIAGWLVGLAYSLPPARLKATVASPFLTALGLALLPIAAWLVVAPLNDFIIAFGAFFFVYSFGFGVTQKFRKTFHALNSGEIQIQQGSSVYNLRTVDLGLKVRTAMASEAIASLGAFTLVPVFWHLGIFDAKLSIGLLVLPLAFTVLSIGLRIQDPVENGQKCVLFMTMAWALIGLLLFAVALTSLIDWGFVVLVCIVFLVGSVGLLRTMHPFGRKSFTAPWREL